MAIDAVALVAGVTTPRCAAEIREVPETVAWLQIRSDLIGDIPADWLRSYFPGKLMYTLRSLRAGGKFDRSPEERRRRLVSAARDYDLVELEADSDLSPGLLQAIPASKRMIAWRGEFCTATELHEHFLRLTEVPARYYSLITPANKIGDGVHPLLLLKTLRRKDLVAYCEGPAGLWSRLLSPGFGAPLLFGQLESHGSQEPDIEQLVADYGFPAIPPVRELYGMVGNRILHSPSPRLHNTAFRLLDQPALFLPFHADSFTDFWKDIIESGTLESLGLPARGLVIVSPYKEAAVAVAGQCSSMVRKVGAGNVFVRRNGSWEANTTDPESIAAVRHMGPVRAAVIGCGGAGRAVAAALQQAGSDVTLVNRGLKRGAYAVDLLGLPFVPLSEFRACGFDLIVNATPVGKDNDGLPFVIDSLEKQTVVIDLAYGACATPLVAAARARGGSAIDGYDVLLTQVRKQFQLMTGLEMPAIIGRETIMNGRDTGVSIRDVSQVSRSALQECEYNI